MEGKGTVEKYTAEEVIGFTLNILRGIMVPAEWAESIGVPIKQAIGNLMVLKDGCERDRAERAAAEAAKAAKEADDGREADAE